MIIYNIKLQSFVVYFKQNFKRDIVDVFILVFPFFFLLSICNSQYIPTKRIEYNREQLDISLCYFYACLRYLHHIYFIILILHKIYNTTYVFSVWPLLLTDTGFFLLLFSQNPTFYSICTKCLDWHITISNAKLLAILFALVVWNSYTYTYIIIIIYSYFFSVTHKDKCKLRLMVKFCKIVINFSYHHMHYNVCNESLSNKMQKSFSKVLVYDTH